MDGAQSLTRSSARPASFRGGGLLPSQWISASEFACLRAHPRLPAAVGTFASSQIQIHAGNALMNAVLGDRGRVMVGFFVLYLDAHPLPGSTRPGATLSAVQTLCRATSLCSAGRAASVLAAMRFGGYVTPKRDSNDFRRRVLVPTQRLIATSTARWMRQFESMAPVFPEAALVPARLAIPSYRSAFLYHMGAYYLAGFRVLDHVPVLAGFAESNAGLLLMSSLALPELTGARWCGERVPISISALSRRFCVSRGHVRNMLNAAVDAGLIVHTPGSEEVAILPSLVEAVIQFYGVLFLMFDRCARQALNESAGHANPLN